MKSILIVEDSEEIRKLYRKKFNQYHYREAGNGAEALKLIEEECPDVVIIDINMPIMDGLTFLRKNTKKFHTIIVTNYPELISEQELDTMNVDEYLIKNEVSLLDVVNVATSIIDKI